MASGVAATVRPTTRFHLVPVTSLALILRVVIVVFTLRSHSAQWFFGQATELAQLGESLRANHCLCSPFGGDTGPSAFLSPGYPVIVASIFAVFHPASPAAAMALMLMQAVFGAATATMLMLFTRRAFSASAANVAGLIWALSPPALFLPTLFWETSLSILLAITIAALSLPLSHRPTIQSGAALGVVMAIAVWVNPSLLPIAVCCLAWAGYRSLAGKLAAPTVAGAIFLTFLIPWPMRNAIELHAFIPFRSNLGYELWQGNKLDSDGYFEPDLHPNVNKVEFRRFQEIGEVRYMAEKSTEARRYIVTQPNRFAVATAHRVFDFWTGIVRHSASLVVGYIVLTTLIGVAGLLRLWLRDRSFAAFFTLPLVFFPIPYYLTHPDFRFRLVIDPLLIALSAYWLTAQKAGRQEQ